MNTRKHTHTMHFATIPRKIRKYACTGRTYGVGVKDWLTQLHNSKYMYSYDSSQKKRDEKRSHTRVMLTHPRPPKLTNDISIVESKLYQKKNLKKAFFSFFLSNRFLDFPTRGRSAGWLALRACRYIKLTMYSVLYIIKALRLAGIVEWGIFSSRVLRLGPYF